MGTRKAMRSMIFAMLAAILTMTLAACGEAESETDVETRGDWDQPIIFGDGDFDSVLFHNRVAQYIIEQGYGYETESVFAGTIAILEGMTNGEIHVRMEVWIDQAPVFLDAVEEGTVVDLGPNYDESIQGWFVPTYVIEGDAERGIEPMAPDLRHVNDLPRYKELFQDPEQPDKGRFYNCIPGWECERVNNAKLQAYGLDEHFTSFIPGSDAALATSLVTANERGAPWLGYYWAPTWIFAQLDLTMLEEPEYTDECWAQIWDGEVGCAYPSVRVQVGANADFANAAPEVTEFLTNYSSTLESTSEVLLHMLDTDTDPDEAAIWWLQEHPDEWAAWVPEDVAERVRDGLAQQ
ncbi:MAG: ABC transporter substrate-binding protein [Chloroflexia bacterium]|nr:ABC transporter substrate-binding protein [Chloroflexia bacterium]